MRDRSGIGPIAAQQNGSQASVEELWQHWACLPTLEGLQPQTTALF